MIMQRCAGAVILAMMNLLMTGQVAAQGVGGGEFPAAEDSPEGMRVIQSEDDVAQPVSIQREVYAERDEMDVHATIISPGGSSNMMEQEEGEPRPLVVYVQGSAWFEQDTSATIPRMMAFVEDTEYVVASVQYRPSTVATAPAQLEDVKSAIRYMRANAERFRIDPERVAIWGDSSGGHLAALVGTTEGEEEFITGDNAEESTRVSAVVDFFGPTDFRAMDGHPSAIDHTAPDAPESVVIGGQVHDPENLEKVQAYNPIHYVSEERDTPPFLIMHGDRDALVPFNQSVLLFEALRGAGKDVTFYKVEDAGHGSRFWTPKVLEIVKAFLGEHL